MVVFACVFAFHQDALAHGQTEVGDYEIEIGFHNEPAIQGETNGLDLFVTNQKTGEPVNGLEETLQAEIIFGSSSKVLSIEPQEELDGAYTAYVIPTEVGDYTWHIFGTIEETPVDISMTSSPDTFGSVEPKVLGVVSLRGGFDSLGGSYRSDIPDRRGHRGRPRAARPRFRSARVWGSAETRGVGRTLWGRPADATSVAGLPLHRNGSNMTRTGRRVTRYLLTACLAVLLGLVISPIRDVLAHANLVRSDPEAGAVLPSSPATATLVFSEALDPDFSKARLADANLTSWSRAQERSIRMTAGF